MSAQSFCLSVIPSSPDKKLDKKFSVSSPQLRFSEQHWAEERSQRNVHSDRSAPPQGRSFKLDDIVPLQCAFPPPPIWTGSDSPCSFIAKLVTEMEPFISSPVCTRPPNPLKGLGHLIETTPPQTAHDVLTMFDNQGRLHSVRWVCEILPHDHKDRKKLPRRKRFHGLSWHMRHFLEACAENPERLPFATQRLIHDADAYMQLSRIKRNYHTNKRQRHADTVQVLLKTGMKHARNDALAGYLLSQYHFDRGAQNTQDFITTVTMVDDAFAMENNDSSARARIALSQKDLIQVLDHDFASPIILEQRLLSWPMWSRFAQSYADRGSCPTGGLVGDNFRRKMLKRYGYIQ